MFEFRVEFLLWLFIPTAFYLFYAIKEKKKTEIIVLSLFLILFLVILVTTL